MILTGDEIAKQRAKGRIVIEPFKEGQVNPNSYDFRLGNTVTWYRDQVLDVREPNSTESVTLDHNGLRLDPGKIYLGHTDEVMGSEHFVPIIRAKSGIARVGLFIHVTADLIDIGSINQWTLQMHAVQPVTVYPNMLIGQVTFWKPVGRIELYKGKYQGSVGPQPSRSYEDFGEVHAAV